MRVLLKGILTLFLMTCVPLSWAETEANPWFAQGEDKQVKLHVELFLSSACPHCQKAETFFEDLQGKEPWLDMQAYVINQNKSALQRFHQALQEQNSDDFSVPTIFFCNSRWVGFDEANTSGKTLLRSLEYCHQQILKEGSLTQQTVDALRQAANANWFEQNIANRLSSLSFLPAIALIDALNPCSFFCLMTLFAFIWIHQQRSVQIGLGLLFLLGIGLIHHLQQGHMALFYQSLAWLRIVAIFLGLGLLAYTYKFYYQEENKEVPSLVVAILVFLTGLCLQAYQQLCMPNFALVFRQWLDAQQFSLARQGGYGILYQLIYLIPLALFIFLIVFLSKQKQFGKFQALWGASAWCMLFIIGLLFIFYPQGFSSLGLSVGVLFFCLLAGWLVNRRRKSTYT